MSETSIVNIEEALKVMDDDKELLIECFDDFTEEYPAMLDRIKQSLDNRDAAELNSVAHKLKGSLRYLAAEQAQQTSAQLEIAGQSNDFTQTSEIFARLQDECKQLKLFISEYKQNNT